MKIHNNILMTEGHLRIIIAMLSSNYFTCYEEDAT